MSEIQAPSAAPSKLDYALDARQRRMLQAMGITLWSAQSEARADQGAAAPKSVQGAAPAQTAQGHAPIVREPLVREPILRQARAMAAPAPLASAAAQAQELSADSLVAHSEWSANIARMAWPDLRDAAAQCRACGLCQSRRAPIFGSGPENAQAQQDVHRVSLDWLIVVDPPSQEEDRQGRPLVGDAGKLLDHMLAAMKVGQGDDGVARGLSRVRDVYVTHSVKCRPPPSRNPTAEEIATCLLYLRRQIELLRPKLIVAMGKFAAAALTGSAEPLGKLRGKAHPLAWAAHAAPVIVTYHPEYLLRDPPHKAKAWDDLILAMQTYRQGLAR